ncbi:MAG: helix-turn-helix domain-containing protein [Eubacteriales bacterium]|nr:helix-turn-helix domain-containing protein [Eubacteriales bacterium]
MLPYQELKAEQLRPDQVSVFVNYRREAGLMVHEHWHCCAELLFVFDGCAEQTLNGERFTFHAGDTLYIAPGAVHATVSVEDRCYIGVAQFHCSGLPSLFLPSGQASQEMAPLFSRLQEEFTLRRPGYASISQGLTLQALGLLERSGTEVGQMPPSTGEAQKISAYLRSHLTERITLETAARAAGYSPAYFSRLFRQWMGMPFKAYLDELMVQAAKGMLEDGLSAAAVSEVLRYDTPSSFGRAFKRIAGETPSGFQERLRKQKMDRKP